MTTKALSPAPHAFIAEWTKLRTSRSTWIALWSALGLAVTLAGLVSASQVGRWEDMSVAERADFDAIKTALVGVLFSTVLVGALGVRSITSEYSTGMIRTTFAATPARRRVLVAKALVLTGLVLPVALLASLGSFLLGELVLSQKDAGASLGDPGAGRAVVLGALAITVTAAIGVGLGALVKRTAAATTTLAVALVGSQLIAVALPDAAEKFLPGTALEAAVSERAASNIHSPVGGLLTLVAYAVTLLLIAIVRIERHDA
jgi:hypothetical protein